MQLYQSSHLPQDIIFLLIRPPYSCCYLTHSLLFSQNFAIIYKFGTQVIAVANNLVSMLLDIFTIIKLPNAPKLSLLQPHSRSYNLKLLYFSTHENHIFHSLTATSYPSRLLIHLLLSLLSINFTGSTSLLSLLFFSLSIILSLLDPVQIHHFAYSLAKNLKLSCTIFLYSHLTKPPCWEK